MALGSYNTGIAQSPSINGQQYQKMLAPFSSVGQGAQSHPLGPAYGSYGAPNMAAGQGYGNAMKALGTTAGNTGANQFSNTVNENEAQLAANQAQAQSGAGIGYQNYLGGLYGNALSRGNAYNSGILDNALRLQSLGYGAAGNLYGLGMGMVNQAVNPLLSGLMGGLTKGLTGIGSSVGNMAGIPSLTDQYTQLLGQGQQQGSAAA